MDDQDKKLAAEFGIDGFEEALQQDLLAQYYETLDLRLAMALEDRLSDEQLDEFEKLHDAGDDIVTENWLKAAIGDYDKIVADETEAVKADIKRTIAAVSPDKE